MNTAENIIVQLEMGKRAMKALHDLSPGGSEYYNDPERCVAAIKHTRDAQMAVLIQWKKDDNIRRQAVLELCSSIAWSPAFDRALKRVRELYKLEG